MRKITKYLCLCLLLGACGQSPNLTENLSKVSTEGTDLPSCEADQHRTSALQFAYNNFGPRSASSYLLGEPFTPWFDSSVEVSNWEPIGVIVYGDVPLSQILESYPIDEAHKIDYRYVHYKNALKYFDWYLAMTSEMSDEGFAPGNRPKDIASIAAQIEAKICGDDIIATWVEP